MGLDAPSSPLHVLETLLANSGHSDDLVRDFSSSSPRCGGSPSVTSAARYGWKPPTHGGSLDGDPFSSNEFLVLCRLDRAPCVTGPQRPSHSRSVGGLTGGST